MTDKQTNGVMEVVKILFDDKRGLPVFVLSDDTKRHPQQQPTGSCWMLYWGKEKQKMKNTNNNNMEGGE